MLKGLDLFVRAVGIIGIWAYHVAYHIVLISIKTSLWSGEIVLKCIWTVIIASVEAVIILIAVIFLKRM